MVFWLAGLRAIHLRENEFRNKYQRYLGSNPLDADRKRKALTAIAAKMARVAYDDDFSSGLQRNNEMIEPSNGVAEA